MGVVQVVATGRGRVWRGDDSDTRESGPSPPCCGGLVPEFGPGVVPCSLGVGVRVPGTPVVVVEVGGRRAWQGSTVLTPVHRVNHSRVRDPSTGVLVFTPPGPSPVVGGLCPVYTSFPTVLVFRRTGQGRLRRFTHRFLLDVSVHRSEEGPNIWFPMWF